MHAVENCIKNYGRSFKCCFVFPNSISQRITFRKALDITGERTLPSELYLSWNMFIKEYIEQKENTEAQEVENITRLLYAEYVIACHQKQPLFKTLIPKTCNTRLFSRWLASILPELQAFLYHMTSDDAEIVDLHVLAKSYFAFLKENKLYEPSWESLHFNKTDEEKRYIIIYPELIDDFSRYEQKLREAKNIEFLHVGVEKEVFFLPLYEAENSRIEIKYVISQIEELLLKGVAFSEIALSVVNIEALKAYILSEAELRGIPIDFYVQTALIDHKFCSIFKEMQEVYSTHYSFEAIKKLLLNKAVPWNFESKIEALLKFGIDHNCSISWQKKGKWQNVWQEAFNLLELHAQDEKEKEIKEIFIRLKEGIDAICEAKTFDDLAICIDEFMLNFIESEKDENVHVSENIQEDIQVISKYRKLLKTLKQTEKKLNKYLDKVTINRYDLFVDVLEAEKIHSEVTGQGISIFPYGAASSIPFKHHFVINLNQQDASIIRGKLKFLRDDKRNAMNIRDVDLTSHFIRSYLEAENVQFSYSKKTYKKYAIAHSFFEEVLSIANSGGCYRDSYHIADSFYREECFYLEGLAFSDSPSASGSTLATSIVKNIGHIYKVQHKGMEEAVHFERGADFSILRESCGSRILELSEAIENSLMKDGHIVVSQSDLYSFFLKCPIYFLFDKLLQVKTQKLSFSSIKSKVIDKLEIGTLYHEILERVYRKILALSDGKFLKSCLEVSSLNKAGSYKSIAKQVLEEIKKEKRYSPLMRLFIQSMQGQIEQAIDTVFTIDSEFFDGYAIHMIEGNLEVPSSDGILYKGKIDRAMKKDNHIVLLDYKTGFSIPKYKIKNDKLENFQMPFYVLLLENAKTDSKGNSLQDSEDLMEKKSVETAVFLKLRQEVISYVFRAEEKDESVKKGKAQASREDFEEVMNFLKEKAKEFKTRITCKDFVPHKEIWQACKECEYKHICRTTFFVRKQFVGKMM